MEGYVQNRLETERLVLEPVTVEVARAVITGDLSTLQAGEGWPHEDTMDAMNTALGPEAGPGWLITLEGRVIGDCGAFGWPNESGAVEIGYGLAQPYRGYGYGTEAAGALCHWLFHEAGATLITAEVLVGNVASQRVLAKLGFAITSSNNERITYALTADEAA
jgi:RimJ/RimL family protein N-acetyltransferase